MTKFELMEGLKAVFNFVDINTSPADITSELNNKIKLALDSTKYSDEDKSVLCAVFLGFTLGRSYGFEQGKEFCN